MGDVQTRKCCCCNLGGTITHYANVTKVRPPSDTLGPNYTSVPFTRGICSDGDLASVGDCSPWLAGGDLNGVSSQNINDTVNDIGPCGYSTLDHNCYETSGTVNTQVKKMFGGQWVFAQKFWHGRFGFTSADSCPIGGSYTSPDQTKYLSVNSSGSYHNSAVSWDGTQTYTSSGSYNGTNSVNQYTGIRSQSVSTFEQSQVNDGTTVMSNSFGNGFQTLDPSQPETFLSNTWITYGDVRFVIVPLHSAADFVCGGQPSVLSSVWEAGGYTINGLDNTGTYFETFVPVSGSAENWSFSGSADCYYNPSGDGVTWVFLATTTVSGSFSCSNTKAQYSYNYTIADYVYSSIDTLSGGATVELGSAYSASACYDDWSGLLENWDMGNVNITGLRQDGQMANAPLIIFDEAGPAVPEMQWSITMDDYSGSLVDDVNGNTPGSSGYVTTWSQRNWIDPNNYIWVYPNGSINNPPSGFTGGATLKTPMRTGTVVSHNVAGSEPHFWFGAALYEREDDGIGDVDWTVSGFGSTPISPCPGAAMRWLPLVLAQYDADIGGDNPPAGAYPQWWWNQLGGVIRGGKFIMATQPWPATNFGRPCGADRFAVDQLSVCCVTAGTGSGGSLTVYPTELAGAPGATNGLSVDDLIMIGGDGIYQITGISGSSPWTVSVSAKLDSIATGLDSLGGGYVGRLRFPTAPGICGRAAISTTDDGTALTITSATAIPSLRDGGGGSIAVDIYDAGMTLLTSDLSLTYVNDSQWTCTSSALPTAAWMVWHGVDWTKNSTTPQNTFVYIAWEFDCRAAYYGTITDWYASVGGCTNATVTQYTFPGNSCRSVIGISPGPEVFPSQNILGPSTFTGFDDIFGAHGQAAVFQSMPDPFWQSPFKGNCEPPAESSFAWVEDDGTSHEDSDDGTTKYFAHRPLVEALSVIPSGDSLPSGVSLYFDPGVNQIPPPYFIMGAQQLSGGIPIGDDAGNFGSLETDWGFTLNVCNNTGRFSSDYAYVNCGVIPS